METTEIIPDVWMEEKVWLNHKNEKPKVEESIIHYILKYEGHGINPEKKKMHSSRCQHIGSIQRKKGNIWRTKQSSKK